MYSSFSEKGEEKLPTNEEISEFLEKGIKPVIFLDSCVCLHIIKVMDYGKKATNVDVQKIISLKKYLEQHPNININPTFAFLELCSNGFHFDLNKLNDFRDRIDFFRAIRLKRLKAMKFDFHSNFFSLSPPIRISDKFLDGLAPFFKNTYCSLLKIRSLAKRDLSKKSAELNIMSFLDWMAEELNIIRGPEYNLAINILGGNTVYRKMIGLDSKPMDAKKKLLGTTWDIFHAKLTSNSFLLSNLLQESLYPYFLTSDANLFNIFKKNSLTLIKDGGENFTTSFLRNSDFNVSHLDESFIDKQNDKMINQFIDRRNQVYHFDEVKVDMLIANLEIENGFID